MKLKKSAAFRASLEGGLYRDIDVKFDDTLHLLVRTKSVIRFYFNMGTEKKSGNTVLAIGSTDFEHVMKSMIDADREATIKAFASAILDQS